MTAPPRHPFNDRKHTPTRPEIDLALGVLPLMELRRLEELIELNEPAINWSMEWYDNERGWGYRASYKQRVLCVLHFYNGYFTVTFAVPEGQEEDYHSIRDLTPHVLQQMKTYRESMKARWHTIRIWKRADVEAVWLLVKKKLEDLKSRAE